jgi:Transposase IS66 family
MADHVGACAATLTPLYELIKAHVFAAERIHGDDTTVPVLAKVKTRTGRIWTYVRDDRPFGGAAPPAAVFFYSPALPVIQAGKMNVAPSFRRTSTCSTPPCSYRPAKTKVCPVSG